MIKEKLFYTLHGDSEVHYQTENIFLLHFQDLYNPST